MSQASSQGICAWSNKIRINSATQSAGCVSFICTATLSGKDDQLVMPVAKKRALQEVLLQEAKYPAGLGRIVGVQHPRHGFGRDFIEDRAREVAVREFAEIEGMRRRGGPQPQSIDALCAISHDRAVVRHSEQARWLVRRKPHRRAAQLECGVERHDIDLVWPRNFPWISLEQPIVRLLDLKAVANRLPEDTVFIAQSVTDGWILQRCQGIDETRRQPAKSAIAQARVRLFLEQRVEVPALL